MNEMVERVAKAMSDYCGAQPDSGVPMPTAEEFLAFARVSIAAMREPTEAVITAARKVLPNVIYETRDTLCLERIYRAMIDEALR